MTTEQGLASEAKLLSELEAGGEFRSRGLRYRRRPASTSLADAAEYEVGVEALDVALVQADTVLSSPVVDYQMPDEMVRRIRERILAAPRSYEAANLLISLLMTSLQAETMHTSSAPEWARYFEKLTKGRVSGVALSTDGVGSIAEIRIGHDDPQIVVRAGDALLATLADLNVRSIDLDAVDAQTQSGGAA